MFQAGGHFAYSRRRRHPSAAPFIFGVKNRVEIFDLEKTRAKLSEAIRFVKSLGASGGMLLFVGGKSEAKGAVTLAAESLSMPFVAGRWIGGTLTNFGQIRSRVDRLLDLSLKRDRGELLKYTKKERLLINREIARLQELFTGIIRMKERPKALFVVDPKREETAVTEARKTGIPVVALGSSDCDFSEVSHFIPGNDSSAASISFFVNEIAAAYKEGANERLSENVKSKTQNDDL